MKVYLHLSMLLFLAFAPLQAKEKKKVALLFLTYNEVNHSKLWKEMLKGHMDKFNVFIHPKTPIKDKFFKLFCVPIIRPTTWMHHMSGWKELLRTALKDKNTVKFVFLSDSCVPLRPLDEVHAFLTKNNMTYMNYRRPWWPETCEREIVQLPKEHRWVHSEWIAVNREHARYIVDDQTVLRVVETHSHSCEAYPACLFSFYNIMDGKVINREITLVDFNRGKDSHPYLFEEATEENLALMRQAREKGMLFVRKVAPHFPVQALKQIIQGFESSIAK